MKRFVLAVLLSIVCFLTGCKTTGHTGPVLEAGPISVTLTMDSNGTLVLGGDFTTTTNPLSSLKLGVGWTAGFSTVLYEAKKAPDNLFIVWEDESGIVRMQKFDIGKPFKVTFSSKEWVRQIEHEKNGSIVVAVEMRKPKPAVQADTKDEQSVAKNEQPTTKKEQSVPEPSCSVAVYNEFQKARNVKWDLLGCPSATPAKGIWMAKEGFEGGQMIWREDLGEIYVRYSSGRWASFRDTWREGQPEFSCPDIGTQSPPVPKRGFGKVWCNDSSVRNGLGKAKNEEAGFYGTVQDFVTGGHIIKMDTGKILVFYSNGTWVDR